MPIPEQDILHQADTEAVIAEVIEETVGQDNAAIADLVPLTGGESPTEAEHNLVVVALNDVLAVLRNNGLVAEE